MIPLVLLGHLDTLLLDHYLLLVVQQRLLHTTTKIQLYMISSLHLSLLVTPIALVGNTMDLVTSILLVVLLNLEHGITAIPYHLYLLLMTKVTSLILQQYLLITVTLVLNGVVKKTTVPTTHLHILVSLHLVLTHLVVLQVLHSYGEVDVKVVHI